MVNSTQHRAPALPRPLARAKQRGLAAERPELAPGDEKIIEAYGDKLYEVAEDTELHKRAELLSAIKEPPFFALKFGPSLLVMPGGLEISGE